MTEQFANQAESSLKTSISEADISLEVKDASKFPTEGNFRLVCGSEIMLATAVAGAKFTVSRAQEGTAAAKHNANAVVAHVLTKASTVLLVEQNGPATNVKPFGTVGDGVVDDTAAFERAIALGRRVVLPQPPVAYLVSKSIQLSVVRCIEGTAALAKVPIIFTGTGHCFEAISSEPSNATKAITELNLKNINVIGEGANPRGALHVNGVYELVLDQFQADKGFTSAESIGLLLENVFSLSFTNWHISVAGVGVELKGGEEQATNIHASDFLVQNCKVGFKIAPTVLAEGLHIENGAIRVPAIGTGVEFTGKVAVVNLGPGLHIECVAAVGENQSVGIKATAGAGLLLTVANFDGIGFYNIKTMFDLDGSTGVVGRISADHIYASGKTGLEGTAFKLNKIVNPVTVGGAVQINSAEYPNTFNLTATNINRSTPPVTTVSGTYSTAGTDRWVFATANTFTITLTTAYNGQIITVRNNGAGTITVAASSGSIAGGVSLAAGAFSTYVCDGTNWSKVA